MWMCRRNVTRRRRTSCWNERREGGGGPPLGKPVQGTSMQAVLEVLWEVAGGRTKLAVERPEEHRKQVLRGATAQVEAAGGVKQYPGGPARPASIASIASGDVKAVSSPVETPAAAPKAVSSPSETPAAAKAQSFKAVSPVGSEVKASHMEPTVGCDHGAVQTTAAQQALSPVVPESAVSSAASESVPSKVWLKGGPMTGFELDADGVVFSEKETEGERNKARPVHNHLSVPFWSLVKDEFVALLLCLLLLHMEAVSPVVSEPVPAKAWAINQFRAWLVQRVYSGQ
eukprot:Skav226953  [mRNA]  locus=scaffold2024:246907:256160:- [translate_table: standard]